MTPVLESTTPEATGPADRGSWRRRAAVLSPYRHPLALPLVLVLLPLLAGVVVLLLSIIRGSAYAPFGDQVYIELHVRDIGHHAVLTGPYSRYGWSHPGPAMYYLLAPLYWLTGDSSQSLAITPLLVNTGCVAGIVLTVRRRAGGAAALWSMLVLAIYLRVLGPELLRDNWNPHLPVLPCALMIFLSWSLACGDAWTLPGIAALATLEVQSHAGFAPAVAACLLVAAVSLAVRAVTAWRRRRRRPAPVEDLAPAEDTAPPQAPSDRARGPRRWLLALCTTVAVLAILWLPPVLDALSHSGGNLRQLLHYFRTAHPDGTWRAGVSWLNSDLGALPAYLTGIHRTAVPPKTPPLPGWTGALALAALAVSMLLAVRRRSRETAVLAALSAALCLAGLVAVQRIVGPLLDYLASWILIAGLVLWTTLGVAIFGRREPSGRDGRHEAAPTPARRRASWVGTVAGLAALAAVATPGEAGATTPWTYTDPVIRQLDVQIVRWLAPNPRDLVRVDSVGRGLDLNSIIEAGNRASALVLALDRSGVQARVASFYVGAYGAPRGQQLRSVRWVLRVVQGSRPGQLGQLVARSGDWFVYATAGPD